MTRRPQLNPAPCADADTVLTLLRENLGRADAYITAAEELIEQPGGGIEAAEDDDDADFRRRRNHLAHLIESAKMAVRAAAYGSDELAKHRGL